MRTSMAMAALLWRWVGWAAARGAAGVTAPERPGRAGGAESVGVGGAGTDRAGEPAQVDVQARHEADAWGLIGHIDGTHGLIV
ncbi:hypothetical protein GCM10009663_59720 [Kitasatospora arboriphila]|uniref:Secreted protein n=1 Tax=Kitasatospora arboriphila TaxID=258052 RepID=A0ABN1TZJ2_9ACTN